MVDIGLLVNDLRRDEGERLQPYLDTRGMPTIGVGRCIATNPLPPGIAAYLRQNSCITPEMSVELLKDDISRVVKQCAALSYFGQLSEPRARAVVEIVFNLGFGGFQKFKATNNALSVGNYTDAAQRLLDSLWAIQVGRRAQRLAAMISNG